MADPTADSTADPSLESAAFPGDPPPDLDDDAVRELDFDDDSVDSADADSGDTTSADTAPVAGDRPVADEALGAEAEHEFESAGDSTTDVDDDGASLPGDSLADGDTR